MEANTKQPSDFTLLIAEDNVGIQVLYQKIFKRDGFNVLVCDNSAQAMAELKENKVDLLITDLEMPKSNTFELFPFLKQDFPKLPVVIVTGHYRDFQEEFRAKGFEISAFLTKPVAASALTTKVREILKIGNGAKS